MPGAVSEQLSVCQGTSLTHLKAAVDEPRDGGGQVKPPLNLSDGALHDCPTQGFAEVAEGQSSQEHLGKDSDRKGEGQAGELVTEGSNEFEMARSHRHHDRLVTRIAVIII